jgi:hypothetical protein
MALDVCGCVLDIVAREQAKYDHRPCSAKPGKTKKHIALIETYNTTQDVHAQDKFGILSQTRIKVL